MKLDNHELHALFVEKDVLFLNHANTVATSITFIKEGGLLSRGTIEEKGLYQSPQSSDPLDKVFGVWGDTFLDTVDLHGYFPRQNYYGPVLFKFSIDFLLRENYEIWITKDNPINWKANMTNDQKYFISVNELRENWDAYERQKKMLTVRNQAAPILFNYLYQVIVDDPRIVVEKVIYFNETVRGLKEAVGDNLMLKNKFKTRECTSCFCTSNYLHQVSVPDLKRLFLPK